MNGLVNRVIPQVHEHIQISCCGGVSWHENAAIVMARGNKESHWGWGVGGGGQCVSYKAGVWDSRMIQRVIPTTRTPAS